MWDPVPRPGMEPGPLCIGNAEFQPLDCQGSASPGSFLRSTSYSFQGPEPGSVWDPASHLPPSSALPTSPATRAQPYLGGGPPLPVGWLGRRRQGYPTYTVLWRRACEQPEAGRCTEQAERGCGRALLRKGRAERREWAFVDAPLCSHLQARPLSCVISSCKSSRVLRGLSW